MRQRFKKEIDMNNTRQLNRSTTLFAYLLIITASLANQMCNAAPMTFFVTTNADSGPGSLRQAILSSNANNPSPGLNTISFTGFSGTITPLTTLPTATFPVLIDGYTALGASPNTNGFNQGSNAVITVQLQGPGAGIGLPVLNGLRLGAGSDGSIIRGLAIYNFASMTPATGTYGNAIRVDSNGCSITGNLLDLMLPALMHSLILVAYLLMREMVILLVAPLLLPQCNCRRNIGICCPRS